MIKATKELSLCGIMTALAVVLLCLGGMLPFAIYMCPMLASIVLIPAKDECRASYAWCCYAASAILGLVLCPDKECAALFLVLGYYPLIYSRLNAIRPKFLQYFVKLMIFAAAVAVMYALLLFLIAAPEVNETLAAAETALAVLTLIIGGIAFFTYDAALGRMINLYHRRRRK